MLLDTPGIWHAGISCIPNSGDTVTIRRCFIDSHGWHIHLEPPTPTTDTSCNYLIENCVFIQQPGRGLVATGDEAAILASYVYGFTVNNCSFYDANSAVTAAYTSGSNPSYLYNSLLYYSRLLAYTLGALVEDYCFVVNNTTYVNVTPGSNSVTRNGLIKRPFLYDGFYIPYETFDFLPESTLKDYGCGQSPASEDFYGITRPTTDSKKTRGAIQIAWLERETTIVPAGEVESIKMLDAGAYQITVPITGDEMSFSVEVYREANYVGTNPQMIIKQPGQSDQTQTDIGSSGQFNTLLINFTPASFPTFVTIEIRSNNTATSGSYATYFGGFEVK